MKNIFATRGTIAVTGLVIGSGAALMQKLGNPPNMGICVACFERDIAGALGLHRAAVVQYIRPEIIGLVLGALLAALIFREFKPRAGSAPLVRFVLGFFAMVGALVFLGCPWRAMLRLAGGDGNALVGLFGLAAGIWTGILFIKSGYNLGRNQKTYSSAGFILPVIMIGLLVLLILQPKFESGALFFSEKGPGSMRAPLLVSLFFGFIVGALAQRTRFCIMGAIRDIILIRDYYLAAGVAGLLLGALITNLLLGQFNPGFDGQPIAQTSQPWNFLGMALAGLAYALSGGCPGRQLFLSGEGDGDAAVFVLGMIVAAGFAHNFGVASSPQGVGPWGPLFVVIGLVACLTIGFTMRQKI